MKEPIRKQMKDKILLVSLIILAIVLSGCLQPSVPIDEAEFSYPCGTNCISTGDCEDAVSSPLALFGLIQQTIVA